MSEFGFPKQNKNQESGRIGQVHFENFVTKTLRWIYRSVPQESDFGVDGYVDVVVDNKVTGRSIAVQIKCGDSYINKKTKIGVKYEGENKHLNYYANLHCPVLLIVFSSDLKQSFWREFDLSITNSGKSGWWIEISRKNILSHEIVIDWLKIAGDITDYSDELKIQWAMDDALKESSFMLLSIPKSEVLQCKFDRVEGIIKKISKNYDFLVTKRNGFDIFFPDYDDDPRELYEIQEIRNWFKKSIEIGIPWLYFLSLNSLMSGLKLLIYCTCEYEISKITEEKHILLIESTAIADCLRKNFKILNFFTNKNEISEDLNKEISEKISNFTKENFS